MGAEAEPIYPDSEGTGGGSAERSPGPSETINNNDNTVIIMITSGLNKYIYI